MNKNYCYLRVSTIEQNLDRQYEAMKQYDIPEENYFVEKISGRTTNRPELQRLLDTVKEGDVIHIHEFSRLSRSTSDLLKIVEELTRKGVTLISNKEKLDTSTSTGKLMLTMIAAINEFEVNCNRDRQLEGIMEAKKRGAYCQVSFSKADFLEVYEKVKAKAMNVTEAAKALGTTRATYYAKVKEYGLV